MNALLAYVSRDAVKIALVLSLSFLIGLEREERKDERHAFGGVRTYPLVGLIGFALSLISGPQLVPLAAGLLVVGAFMLLSYRNKLQTSQASGITSEMSALVTYLGGALIGYDHLWMATALMVASVLLLELKSGLEHLTQRISADEIISFAKFLLLSAVILPIVPDQRFTRFQLNPFKTWLIVVAVSSVSYGSYVLQKLLRGRGGVLLSAILGGAYSSTVTTVVLSRRSRAQPRPHLYAGSILTASGMMYLRLTLLVALFGRSLLSSLAPPFLTLAALALGFGAWWSRRSDGDDGKPSVVEPARNPLELGAAVLFGAIFVVILVVTQVVLAHVGQGGVYTLAAIIGIGDVDPFILGLTQTAGASTPAHVAALAIVIAAASNNVGKAIYALVFAERRTGLTAFAFLLGLAGLGLGAWFWI